MPLTELIHYFNNRNREQYGAHICPRDSLASVGGRIVGLYAGLTLETVFQPIADGRTGELIAHEALLRSSSKDGRPISPLAVFVVPTDDDELVFLDRLCRTVHALNFLLQAEASKNAGSDLYLNINARHLLHVASAHGQTFEEILRRCGLAPSQAVLEILESAIDDSHRLAEAVANYRERGYRIAIDNFGRDHLNCDRLRQLSPEIVKIDRSLVVKAAEEARGQRFLRNVVDIAHELGALTVAEGIESEAQLQIALEAGVDRVQGFMLARPQPACLVAGQQLWPQAQPHSAPVLQLQSRTPHFSAGL
jgi:EAL domain-containing protein (putative c-di-GMP-specific phosphodiesterase class I)